MKLKCIIFAFLSMFILISIISCSPSLGYSVVLWSIPESNIYDGDVVHVLIKSKIMQVYVIEKDGVKTEVPFWSITVPEKKSKAKESLLKYQEFQHKYALVALDGLPMRERAVNTSRQVYRLREQEKVRVLYKEEGEPVMAGNKRLEGDWLRIMTNDGTQGWCFSYNLRIFDEKAGVESIKQTEKVDNVLKALLEKRWWPESYRTMIETGKIDLKIMNSNYGFVTGSVTGQVRFTLQGVNLSYPFEGVTKRSNDIYSFDNTPITVTVKKDDFIVLEYINDKGAPQAFNLITLADNINIEEIIKKENDRRNNLWDSLRMSAKIFSSSNYGVLQFLEGKKFIWNGYKLLTPDFIPANVSTEGSADFKYYLSKNLSGQFDGVLTLIFDGSKDEINFFYKLESNGLRLESAKGATFKGNTLNARSSSPMVIFFQKK
ncbi:MAG: SH3 domain-containing protein [Treponema sp.]|nr:SH3 domain-containing protein [Treponema sp.]